MPHPSRLNRSVALPLGLDPAAIGRAVKFIEKQLVDLVEIYYEQANVFSSYRRHLRYKGVGLGQLIRKAPSR